jgi:hypothetical protein
MSSRRLNRIETFRRASAGGWFDTSLLPAGNPHPRDRPAIRDWYLREPIARPTCFCCSNLFATENRPAAFLTARSSRVPNGGVAVTAACRECWARKTAGEIETAAAAVLRRNLTGPAGRFLD